MVSTLSGCSHEDVLLKSMALLAWRRTSRFEQGASQLGTEVGTWLFSANPSMKAIPSHLLWDASSLVVFRPARMGTLFWQFCRHWVHPIYTHLRKAVGRMQNGWTPGPFFWIRKEINWIKCNVETKRNAVTMQCRDKMQCRDNVVMACVYMCIWQMEPRHRQGATPCPSTSPAQIDNTPASVRPKWKQQ